MILSEPPLSFSSGRDIAGAHVTRRIRASSGRGVSIDRFRASRPERYVERWFRGLLIGSAHAHDLTICDILALP